MDQIRLSKNCRQPWPVSWVKNSGRNYVRGLIGTHKGGKVRRVDMSAGLQKVLQAYTHPPTKKELAK